MSFILRLLLIVVIVWSLTFIVSMVIRFIKYFSFKKYCKARGCDDLNNPDILSDYKNRKNKDYVIKYVDNKVKS